MNTKEFIQKSKEKFGNQYFYEKTKLVNTTTNVVITCPIHGDFEQLPWVHLRSKGCPKCSKGTYNTKEFIEKAIKIHGDFYDYSKTIHTTSNGIVTITCPIHGDFKIAAGKHLKGQGCPKCKKQKNFIEKATKIHPEYDYSKVDYIDSKTPITVICKEHGEFTILPSNLLRGFGCSYCSNHKSTSKVFIEKAKKVHGDKYDYSKVNYINNSTPVTIICPKHGEFQQKPNNHLNGQNCPKCANEDRRFTKKEFISRAKKIHGDYYIYDLVPEYPKFNTKVTIICPKHGEFEQFVNNHLQDSGCPKCHKSLGEKQIMNILEQNHIDYKAQYKIVNDLIPNKHFIADFYILYNNIAIIIEYNGKQHYVPVEHFGGEEQFKKQQERDELLRKFCEFHNIKLLEIPYTENNIEKVILDFFNNLKP